MKYSLNELKLIYNSEFYRDKLYLKGHVDTATVLFSIIRNEKNAERIILYELSKQKVTKKRESCWHSLKDFNENELKIINEFKSRGFLEFNEVSSEFIEITDEGIKAREYLKEELNV